MKYVIIGFGGRGHMYSLHFAKHKDVELIAVCDTNDERLQYAAKVHNLSEKQLYSSADSLFAEKKSADLCVIATQDASHHGIAVKALELGYDLMLEKPIATSFADCDDIYRKAEKLGRKVYVCHVLRYSPFFLTIKNELDSGKYGNVSTINLTENVAYWHHAHSYVRGNWRISEQSTPMIIAKCCHDLDILVWLMGSGCKAVSSMGSLNLFKKENKPDGASSRCYDCKYNETCAYSAIKIYIHNKFEKGVRDWPCDVLCLNPTKDKLMEAIKNGQYGKCIFECDNNVVDHQVVNMEFDSHATAHLTMTAFSEDCYRDIHVHCEYGEIYGNMSDNMLTCTIFGGEKRVVDVNKTMGSEGMSGHGGGDARMVADIVDSYQGKSSKGLTSIEKSILSHKIGFASERSRLAGGELIKLK